MHLTLLQLALVALLLLSQTIVAPSPKHEELKKEARERLEKNMAPKKGDVLQFHSTAGAYAYERKPVTKDILVAGKDGSRTARADMKGHLADHHFGAAIKDAANVVKRPVKGAFQYAGSSIVDLSSRVKHSSVGRALTPKIKTNEALAKKKEMQAAKHEGRIELRNRKSDELRNGKTKPVPTTNTVPNAVDTKNSASVPHGHNTAHHTQHEPQLL